MRNTDKLTAWLVAICLVLSAGAIAADKKKTAPVKPPPPIPTDESLGFFDNTRDQMLSSMKRLGVMPITDLPSSLRERDEVKQALTDAVMKYLQAAKFEVVAPASYQAIYDKFNQQLGGMYDPSTGAMKRDVYKAVTENARRDFGSKEKLDGFVYIRLRTVAAPYSGDYAYWDGVHELTDGRPAPKNAFAAFWMGTDTQGSVPALSLLVQIVNKQDRVVYGRHGGLQVVAYHVFVTGKGYEFRYVGAQDQLKDAERIDRAARVATLPLVRTPKEISLGDEDPMINARRIDLSTLPPPPPGHPFAKSSPLLVPRAQVLQSVHRVALGPLDTDEFDVPKDVQQRFVDSIKQELAPLNWEIIDAPNAVEMLVKGMMETRLFDPLTGKRDEAKASAVRKGVFNSLGIKPVPDAILWISLDKTAAVHQGGDVEWDGAAQNGFTMGPVIKKFWSGSGNPQAGSGGVAALSLSVYLADGNDTGLYRSRGGIQLLQKLRFIPPTYTTGGRGEPVDLAPGELFHDPERERASAHYALRDLVMEPEALQAEVNPPPPGSKKKKKK
ncbi:MAG TPA: hypothetical protein VFL16_04295 [Steroidobacteraceae bacterium]|nr:hypothetical protein [Steroidobacteraceae bacterium]